MKSITINIRGKVQGVYFRQCTADKARKLGISGYVKNESDGSVCILATGEVTALDDLIEWCWQGPPEANVTDVQVNDTALAASKGFTILRGG
jgi:acylphosphatase